MFKFKSHIFLAVPALAVTALLAACGGGGDGGGDTITETPMTPSQEVASVNVAAAWHNLLTGTGNWQTTGIGPDGKKYGFSVETHPGSPGAFSFTGDSGATSILTSRISIDGVDFGTATQTLYYNGSNLFGIDYDDGTCSVVPPLASTIPGASPVGSSGDFATSRDYVSCALPQQSHYATTENHWTIESDSNVTLFCITSTTINLASQLVMEKGQDCLEAAADGTLGKKARFTIYLSDTSSIVTRNF